jgi:CheY-like chemotaxis protein
VTGNATLSDERRYAEAGFTSTLGKPFTLEALRAAIERHAAAAPAAAL